VERKTGYTVVEEVLSTSRLLENLQQVAAKSSPEEALLLGATAARLIELEATVKLLEKGIMI
jgi:hypothetical protein